MADSRLTLELLINVANDECLSKNRVYWGGSWFIRDSVCQLGFAILQPNLLACHTYGMSSCVLLLFISSVKVREKQCMTSTLDRGTPTNSNRHTYGILLYCFKEIIYKLHL